jgi:hypothetical protein
MEFNMINFDKRVIVCDDFFPDPHGIRDIALESQYEDYNINNNYPGINSKNPFWDNNLQAILSSITGSGVYPTPNSSCGHFRSTKKNDTSKQVIHFDPKPEQKWAGVVYLSLPKDYQDIDCGTKMYRHKKSNMSVAPFDYKQSSIIGVRTQEDMVKFFETDGVNDSLWDVEMNVPFKFNRLVLFRPWMWHGIAGQFGNSIETSRLTQLIFLNEY